MAFTAKHVPRKNRMKIVEVGKHNVVVSAYRMRSDTGKVLGVRALAMWMLRRMARHLLPSVKPRHEAIKGGTNKWRQP